MMTQKFHSKSGKKSEKERESKAMAAEGVAADPSAPPQQGPERDALAGDAATPQGEAMTEVKKDAVSATSPAQVSSAEVLTQREAVFQEVMRVVQDDQVPYSPEQPLKPLLNEAQLKRIYAALGDSFRAGKVSLKSTEGNQKKLAEPKVLEIYIIGLVNNWLRRDNRLNGKPKKTA